MKKINFKSVSGGASKANSNNITKDQSIEPEISIKSTGSVIASSSSSTQTIVNGKMTVNKVKKLSFEDSWDF